MSNGRPASVSSSSQASPLESMTAKANVSLGSTFITVANASSVLSVRKSASGFNRSHVETPRSMRSVFSVTRSKCSDASRMLAWQVAAARSDTPELT
jgi:hypothetical protein